MPPIDPEKFNNDPKHEKDRADFDKLVEGAFNRIAERKQKEKPKPQERGFLDDLLEGMFPSKDL